MPFLLKKEAAFFDLKIPASGKLPKSRNRNYSQKQFNFIFQKSA